MWRWVKVISPLATTLASYRRDRFVGDLVAGLVVAVMLVPQAMAYAMLAGLPPQVGLYASIVPLILYAVLGTSNSLAVGPVAMVSLLVFTGVGALATPGSPEFIGLCLTLALMVGVWHIAMAVLRLGFLVNFISHPVLVGFTSAAAIVIGFSQVKHLIGVSVESGGYPIHSIFTAIFVAISVLFLTPLFYYIPNTVLAAIIIVAVAPLVDFNTPIKLWHFSRNDAFGLLVTFVAVLATGIETGILLGVAASIVMLMSKMSRPHVAEVGRIGDSEHFRNVDRYDVQMTAGVFAFRVDESLYFANSPFLQSYVMEQVVERPDIQSVLLVCSGINEIDATGLDVLETIHRELKELGIGFYLSDVKGPVTDRFKLAGFDESFMREHIFLSTDAAMQKLSGTTEL